MESVPDWTSAEACGARQPARKARGATQSDEFGHGVQGSTQPDEFGHGVQSSIVHSKQLAARRRTRELMHRLTALTLPPRAWRHFDLYDLRNENRIARISRRSVRARSAARGHRFQRNAGKAAASSEAGDSQAFTFRCGLSETRVKRAVPVSCEVRAVLALRCSREPAVGSHLPRGRWLHGGTRTIARWIERKKNRQSSSQAFCWVSTGNLVRAPSPALINPLGFPSWVSQHRGGEEFIK